MLSNKYLKCLSSLLVVGSTSLLAMDKSMGLEMVRDEVVLCSVDLPSEVIQIILDILATATRKKDQAQKNYRILVERFDATNGWGRDSTKRGGILRESLPLVESVIDADMGDFLDLQESNVEISSEQNPAHRTLRNAIQAFLSQDIYCSPKYLVKAADELWPDEKKRFAALGFTVR